MADQIWTYVVGDGPIIATAIHDGHHSREEVVLRYALDDLQREREEDPFTGHWTTCAPTRVIGLRSRFEVDLNRPREKAVYRVPEDAWGLTVWKDGLPDDVYERSLAEYDATYEALKTIYSTKADEFGRFVVLDLHTYNHRRAGADGPEADPETNPQVNVGTGTMDREKWAPVVNRVIESLREFDFPGGKLDVRENVKFLGGQHPKWVHETFPETGCRIAVEFKKFFMDEWTGQPNPELVDAIGSAMAWAASSLPEVLMASK